MVHFGLSKTIHQNKCKNLPSIIAEIKVFSPRYGDLLKGRNPIDILDAYEQHGATGISYITASEFKGNAELFSNICKISNLPVLRKDFVTDTKEIDRTYEAGASAILLIGRLLKERTSEFVDYAMDLGLDTLVEVHTIDDVDMANQTSTTMIGINNRNIACFEKDDGTVEITEQLHSMLNRNAILVSESGIATPDDMRRAARCTDAALIGTALMRAQDPGNALREFMEAV